MLDPKEHDAWKKLAFDQNPLKLESFKKEQLTPYVLHYDLPQGTKSSVKMMALYIRAHICGNEKHVCDLFNGERLDAFKLPRIKQEIAKLGILPDGTYAELLNKLMYSEKVQQALFKQNPQLMNNQQKATLFSKQIIALSETNDYQQILSILGSNITKDSTIGEMRKAYLKISLIIHPDKNKFEDATKAFQILVRAVEYLTHPELQLQESQDLQQTQLRRSNEGNIQNTTQYFQYSQIILNSIPDTSILYQIQQLGYSLKIFKIRNQIKKNSFITFVIILQFKPSLISSTPPLRTDPTPQPSTHIDFNIIQSINNLLIGCYRSQIKCPRCRVEWNFKKDGNPDYYYTIFMTGMKQFHCSTCLLQFGCISAIHKCPFCNKGFEYDPADYHRQIKCINCEKTYGFFEYFISDFNMNQIKQQIKDEVEQRIKQDQAKLRRNKSAENRKSEFSDQQLQQLKEQAYLIGLSDLCPRCGIDLDELDEEMDQFTHLRDCNNEIQHEQYQLKLKKQQERHNQKVDLQKKQDDLQKKALFDLYGAQNNMLWILSEDQLKEKLGQDQEISKSEMIKQISQKNNKQSNISTIPKNLYGLSLDALDNILIGQGYDPKLYQTKQQKINILENLQFQDNQKALQYSAEVDNEDDNDEDYQIEEKANLDKLKKSITKRKSNSTKQNSKKNIIL